ncbi:MAG: tripartite tricarboxylate transporter substrate binding protein [Burkholderiales bacterium]|nr:tripartite tricarboxylate transporter substrate binding protein [Burkholderiales bacterium]
MPGILHAAQPYPTKPVRLIVPFAPGGGTDIMARTLSQKLVELWRQQIVVDNRGGAGTVIGTELTVRSPADGYTLMLANIAMALNPGLREKLPYDALRDLAPVILIASQPSAVAVNPTVPAKTVKELIKLAKADKLSFASSGIGGVGHIGGEMFRIAIGADMVHVPYKGGGPAAVDLMAGQVPVAFISLPTVTPHARNGRLRIVAITDSARSAAAPDIPTVSETVKGYAVDNWIGMLAPAKVPGEIITRLNGDVLKLIGQADMKQRLTDQGFDVRGSSPGEFGEVIRSDIEKYTKVIRQAGIKAN